MDKKFLSSEIKDLKIYKGISVEELIRQFSNIGGFNAKNLAIAVQILQKMLNAKNCVKFLSFTGNLVATGLRGLLRDLIKYKLFDVVITTCGTLDHDIARTYAKYYCGTFEIDDKKLHKMRIHRLGNVFIPCKNYGIILEKKLHRYFEACKNDISGRELIYEIGKNLTSNSILYWCSKNNIPVFVPGLYDGAVGSNIWLYTQKNTNFRVNLIQDQKELANIVFSVKVSAALILGGGISKHHTIWWNQFKNGLDYAIQITTGIENDGSLTGAKLNEAITWGKINPKGKYVTVYGDATIILPLIIGAVINENKSISYRC